MSDLLDRKPRQLSGGQRQRVAMGRAIVREPTAFLMDEPLSNLDAKLRVEMRGEITSLQRRIGTPTLYVTHDQTEAMTMGDRVAILRDGVLEQLGTPAELYERPVNMFVASFIGSPAMNLIEGTCEADAGAPFVRFGNSRLSVPDAVAARCAELRDFVGREICVGIRPEDFVAATGARGRATRSRSTSPAPSRSARSCSSTSRRSAPRRARGSSALSWATRSRRRRSPARR